MQKLHGTKITLYTVLMRNMIWMVNKRVIPNHRLMTIIWVRDEGVGIIHVHVYGM